MSKIFKINLSNEDLSNILVQIGERLEKASFCDKNYYANFNSNKKELLLCYINNLLRHKKVTEILNKLLNLSSHTKYDREIMYKAYLKYKSIKIPSNKIAGYYKTFIWGALEPILSEKILQHEELSRLNPIQKEHKRMCIINSIHEVILNILSKRKSYHKILRNQNA